MLIGALSFQNLEGYWVVDPDIRKDSNLEITLLSRLLHLTSEKLAAPLPHQWPNHCDNATGEGDSMVKAA